MRLMPYQSEAVEIDADAHRARELGYGFVHRATICAGGLGSGFDNEEAEC